MRASYLAGEIARCEATDIDAIVCASQGGLVSHASRIDRLQTRTPGQRDRVWQIGADAPVTGQSGGPLRVRPYAAARRRRRSGTMRRRRRKSTENRQESTTVRTLSPYVSYRVFERER